MRFTSQQHKDNSEHPDFYVDLDAPDQAEVEYEDAIEAFAEEFGLTKDEAWELHWKINDGTANIDALYEVMEAQELEIAA